MKLNEFKIYKNKIGVYCILNLINGKRYIGSTTNCFYKRLNHHLCMLRINKHKNTYLQHSWNKYGKDNFKFIILNIMEDKELIRQKEQLYLNNCLNLYNINLQADSPCTSEETKLKKSLKMKSNWEKGIHKGNTGNTAWNKGRCWTKEEREKLKASAKNRKMSQSGKIKKKQSVLSKKQKVVSFYNNQIEGIYRSLTDVVENIPIKSERFNLTSITNVSKCCRGIKESHLGIKFRFLQPLLVEKLKVDWAKTVKVLPSEVEDNTVLTEINNMFQ